MKERTEFKQLSQRTRQLIGGQENLDVDFKISGAAIKQKTLVAFANTPTGGTLLIGVEEYTSGDGVQRGRIVGCEVDDTARLTVQNKALSCVPPVPVEIFVENMSREPILRVEIPHSLNRPHCTSSGEYCVRADGRNRALLPSELLQLFMDRESEQFVNRFKSAVEKLENQLETMDGELKIGVDRMISDIMRLDHDTSYILNELYGRSLDIGKESELSRKHDSEVIRKLKNIKVGQDKKVKNLARKLTDLTLKVDAILEHMRIEDPLRVRARSQIQEMARMVSERSNPELLADFVDVLQQLYPDITPEVLNEWVSEFVKDNGEQDES